jgi:hypothetical protein
MSGPTVIWLLRPTPMVIHEPRPAPRIPREKPSTYLFFLSMVAGLGGMLALECWTVVKLVGWVRGLFG